jgi:hypothetical protein
MALLKADLDSWFVQGVWPRIVGGALLVYLVVCLALGVLWSREPELHDVIDVTRTYNQQDNRPVVTGSTTTTTLLFVAETLLEKPGGFLSNDVLLPGVWLDNMPNWEFGALVQVRDMARAMRESFSRSQSQSTEDPDLAIAEPRFNFDNESWIFPASESEYREGIHYTREYLQRLSDPGTTGSQFYARADNLANWLATVETRLGSLSQRLSASVGQRRVNTDLAGDAGASQSTEAALEVEVKTPWNQVDDVFFEARGTTWALVHLLRAVEVDFADVLQKKNALVSLRQIIRELEASQQTVWSPVILNGSGFGLFANHSLVMASYISRANAAIIDLRELLNKG